MLAPYAMSNLPAPPLQQLHMSLGPPPLPQSYALSSMPYAPHFAHPFSYPGTHPMMSSALPPYVFQQWSAGPPPSMAPRAPSQGDEASALAPPASSAVPIVSRASASSTPAAAAAGAFNTVQTPPNPTLIAVSLDADGNPQPLSGSGPLPPGRLVYLVDPDPTTGQTAASSQPHSQPRQHRSSGSDQISPASGTSRGAGEPCRLRAAAVRASPLSAHDLHSPASRSVLAAPSPPPPATSAASLDPDGHEALAPGISDNAAAASASFSAAGLYWVGWDVSALCLASPIAMAPIIHGIIGLSRLVRPRAQPTNTHTRSFGACWCQNTPPGSQGLVAGHNNTFVCRHKQIPLRIHHHPRPHSSPVLCPPFHDFQRHPGCPCEAAAYTRILCPLPPTLRQTARLRPSLRVLWPPEQSRHLPLTPTAAPTGN